MLLVSSINNRKNNHQQANTMLESETVHDMFKGSAVMSLVVGWKTVSVDLIFAQDRKLN